MKQLKQTVLVGLGSGIEYYDFAIFAFFATSISESFFPLSNIANAIFYTFLIFALGYIVRPIGGLVFGFVGDRYGRKIGFLITMFVLMVATLCMAVLPTSSKWGSLATVLFVLFRCCQGMAIGGDIPTATTFVVEHAKNRPGLYSSVLYASIMLGMVMTSLVYFLLTKTNITSYWGIDSWRVAFLIGAFLSFVMYFLRKNLCESNIYLEATNKKITTRKSFITKQIIGSIMLVAVVAMITTQLVIFMPSYLNNYIHWNVVKTSNAVFIGSLLMIPACIISGVISDYINKKIFFIILISLLMLVLYLFYTTVINHCYSLIFLFTACFIYGMLPSTYPVILVKAYPVGFRCRGVGISYNVAYSLFSAPIPALTVWMINKFNSTFIPYWCLLICFIITLVGIYLIQETKD